MIWRRRKASCFWRTTTRRTCEVTRPRPWGTCCRRPGTCYVSSTDPSMSTCPGFSTPTITCGQTDCYRNRYQTTCITTWYIIPRGLSVCVLFMYFIGIKESCNKIKMYDFRNKSETYIWCTCMNDIYVTVYGVKQENGIKIKNPNHCFNWLISFRHKVVLPINLH